MGSFNGITYAFGQWNKKKELDIRSSFNSNMQYWGAWLHDLKKKKEKGFFLRAILVQLKPSHGWDVM